MAKLTSSAMAMTNAPTVSAEAQGFGKKSHHSVCVCATTVLRRPYLRPQSPVNNTVDLLLARIADSTLSLDERIAAAHALAKLGDPRASAIDRVLVPEGPFMYRGGPDAPQDSAKTVHLSAFSIDRYPVTVAAFATFIYAGGYQQRRYWSDRGWSWRCKENIKTPRFWGEDEWAAYLVPNHPVVGVSVYEAEAYAAFRGARLPTCAQWEKACRGSKGCCYPWGNDFIDGYAGSRNLGPRCTVPIGSFPLGKSPYGVYDMVGCIWQWCADAADDQAHIDDTDPWIDPEDYAEDTPRVTRGGAWNTLAWNVICTSKNAYAPTARFSNLGFRLVSAEDDD